MIQKFYLSANEYLLDSCRLARQILDSGWRPDDLLALWRGGTPVAVMVHEFLYYHGLRPNHRPVKCQSYTDINARSSKVVFECAEDVFASMRPGEKVLVIDDVFDSGHTAAAVLEKLLPLGVDVKLAMVYWKPNKNQTALRPDFYVRETDDWIVFPHEMQGLTPDEVKLKDPVIYDLLADTVKKT